MSHLLRKIFSATLFSLVLFSLFSFSASAQGVTSVFVKDLKLDNTTYQAGKIVKGSFNLLNPNQFADSDIYVKISLDGGFSGGVASFTYTYDLKGPFYILPGQQNNIPFEFKLPVSVSDPNSVGIKVRATTKNGISLSYQNQMITVTNSKPFFDITEATLSSGKDVFAVSSGPTVHGNEAVILNFTAKNSSDEILAGTPNITIYNMDSAGKILKKITADQIFINPKNEKTVNIKLPEDLGSGVFYGEMNILNKDGVEISQMVPFRYIIGGDIATIQSVQANKNQLSKDETFKVSVFFTGIPFDIRSTSTVKTSQVYDLSLKIQNETGVVVGETDSSLDFGKGNEKVFSLIATDSAKALSASVVVRKGNEIITTYQTTLSRVSDYKGNTGNLPLANIWFDLVFAIIIVAIFFFLFKSFFKKNKAVLMVLVAISICSFVGIRTILANTGSGIIYDSQNEPCYNGICTSLSFNYIGDKQPGEIFNVSGSLSYRACANGSICFSGLLLNDAQSLGITSGIINNGSLSMDNWKPFQIDSTTGSIGSCIGGGGKHYSAYSDFNVPGFVAPSKSGAIGINFYLTFGQAASGHGGEGGIPNTWTDLNWQKTASNLYYPSNFKANLGSTWSWSGHLFYNVLGQPTCTDGIKNGNETGIDCGGSCPNACALPQDCGNSIVNSGEVCDSTNLNNATCSSVNLNFTGGTLSCSPSCTSYNTSLCTGRGGCIGSACDNLVVNPTCTDGIKNGNETGIDCGGSCAKACSATGPCVISTLTGSSTINQLTTWAVNSACTPSCTYSWSGSDISSVVPSAANTLSKIYTTVGIKNIYVDILNQDGSHFCSPYPAMATTSVNFGGGSSNEK